MLLDHAAVGVGDRAGGAAALGGSAPLPRPGAVQAVGGIFGEREPKLFPGLGPPRVAAGSSMPWTESPQRLLWPCHHARCYTPHDAGFRIRWILILCRNQLCLNLVMPPRTE